MCMRTLNSADDGSLTSETTTITLYHVLSGCYIVTGSTPPTASTCIDRRETLMVKQDEGVNMGEEASGWISKFLNWRAAECTTCTPSTSPG